MRRAAGLFVLAVIFSLGGAVNVNAQTELLGPGAGYFSAGVSRMATDDLDDRLASRGYPTFGTSATGVSLGAYRVLAGGLMLGAEWNGLIVGGERHEGRDVGLGAGYGTFGIGYLFQLSTRVRVYPRLGVGGGGVGVWIQREEEVGFDDVLTDPQPVSDRDPVLSRDGLVVDMGGGVEFLPGGGDLTAGGPGLLVGLRLGYLAAPWSSSWTMYGDEATGGPDASIAGPYLRLSVGMAWGR